MIPTTYEELLELYNQQSKSRLSLLSMIEGLQKEAQELRSYCLSVECKMHNLYNENERLSEYKQLVHNLYPGLKA